MNIVKLQRFQADGTTIEVSVDLNNVWAISDLKENRVALYLVGGQIFEVIISDTFLSFKDWFCEQKNHLINSTNRRS